MDSAVKCALTGFLVFALLAVIFYTYTTFVVKREKYIDGPSNGKVRVCLIYATWCPHCERYLESNIFDNTYSKVRQREANIVFEKIDYEENKNLASKYGVNSFPTIIAIDARGNKIAQFEGNRNDPSSLETFAMQSYAKSQM
jgi:thiol-disulfide isomerase/thioredoxin